MPSFFENTCGIEDPKRIFDMLESNCSGSPSSESQELWRLRQASCIGPTNPYKEKLLEKAVAMLAEKDTCLVGSISVQLLLE